MSAVHQPDDVRTNIFPKPTTALGLVEQAFRRVPFFTKWVICKFLWSNPCKIIEDVLPLGTSTSGTSGSRWFSLILPHERILRRIWWWTFSTLIHIVDGNCNCLLSHTVRWFPITNNLQEFFVHAVLFPDSWPRRSSQNFPLLAPKILISNFLLDTSFHHSFQSVIIRS